MDLPQPTVCGLARYGCFSKNRDRYGGQAGPCWDHANIEITPRISYEDSDGSKGIIRFTKAATSLSVPLGQWVNIGGTDNESNEVIKAILERGSGKKNSSTSISLLVEKY
jgi:hypothetical protein